MDNNTPNNYDPVNLPAKKTWSQPELIVVGVEETMVKTPIGPESITPFIFSS